MTPEQAQAVLLNMLNNERSKLSTVQAEAVAIAASHLKARDLPPLKHATSHNDI